MPVHRQTGPVNQERALPVAVGLDTFMVVLFVAIGRRTHDESGAFTAVVETALPFLIGLATAWLIVRAWRRPTHLLTGLAVWPIVVLLGMVVRQQVFDEGTATSFVVVATLFLGASIVGWRLLYRLYRRRRPALGPDQVRRPART